MAEFLRAVHGDGLSEERGGDAEDGGLERDSEDCGGHFGSWLERMRSLGRWFELGIYYYT